MIKEKIALISGTGKLPSIFFDLAKDKYEIHVFALFDDVDPNLKTAKNYLKVSFEEITNAMLYFGVNQIKKTIMLGKVKKSLVFNDAKIDDTLLDVINSSENLKDSQIVLNIINFLEKYNIEVLNQDFLMKDFVVQKINYTPNIKLLPEDENTITLGVECAQKLADLDIGQTVVAKNMSIIAVEGIEGTNKTIERAYEYAKYNCIIIKQARPDQDLRIDTPVIGIDTIKLAIKIKAKGIVIESNKMLFIDQKEALEIANKNNLFIIGL